MTIKKSVDYILNHPKQIKPYQWLAIDYLQRKYNLDNRITTDFELSAIQAQDIPDDFGIYIRIIRPDNVASSLPSNHTSPLETMMMSAMICDKITLSKNFSDLVEQNIKAGGYSLTHAAFALQRLNENDCHPFDDSAAAKLKQQTVDGMTAIANQDTNTQDLKFEAIAFLLDMGATDQVSESTIQQIASSQLPDGSWATVSGGTKTNDHSTVLALWVLLEYTQPNASKEPMIRHSAE